MSRIFLTLLVISAGVALANFVCAANPLDIVISEIAWMGTKTSAMNEWIELYNNTTSTIDITNWTLKSSNNSPNIIFHSETGSKIEQDPVLSCFLVQNHGFYLMERTNDDTVTDIPANHIYTGALNNTGEALELRDAQGNLIDAVDFADTGWPAGDNATKKTMERKNLLLFGNADNWQTSALSGGTPCSTAILREPSRATEESPPSPAEQLSVINNQSNDQPSPEPQTIEYPNGVVINEILPSPDGPDVENEWIEIFNQNNFPVNISDWKIADTEGKTKSYDFPQNTIIKAKSFLLLTRPQTKITLNNDADGLNLMYPDKTITNSILYSKAKLNKSYNRINDNWVWSDTLTPGWENIIPDANKIGDVPEFSSKRKNSETSPILPADANDSNADVNRVNSDISADYNKHFTASLLSLFSAFSILALKRSLNKP